MCSLFAGTIPGFDVRWYFKRKKKYFPFMLRDRMVVHKTSYSCGSEVKNASSWSCLPQRDVDWSSFLQGRHSSSFQETSHILTSYRLIPWQLKGLCFVYWACWLLPHPRGILNCDILFLKRKKPSTLTRPITLAWDFCLVHESIIVVLIKKYFLSFFSGLFIFY